MMPGDAFEIRDDDHLIMLLVFYMTNKRIHGIWHHEATNQIFFCGYECQKCHEVFLVPDSVKDNATLHQAMHHKCMEER
jgi:hypothetical protein